MWVIAKSNSEGRAFMALLIAFLILAFLMFGMRLNSRRLKKASLDASDFLCFVGLVCLGSPPKSILAGTSAE